ncbi:hypothetical protein LUX32_28830 [Actinomadura madurae]|nr:hypothetical protein [Actinomadura madurae]MCP9981197.1 hypothetical protein [Actinomadura madurae]
MPRVATLISTTARVSAVRRPSRSPRWPNTTPPTGRMAKPTAKTAKVDSSRAVGSWPGKNWVAMVVAK